MTPSQAYKAEARISANIAANVHRINGMFSVWACAMSLVNSACIAFSFYRGDLPWVNLLCAIYIIYLLFEARKDAAQEQEKWLRIRHEELNKSYELERMGL